MNGNVSNTIGSGVILRHKTAVRRFLLSSNKEAAQNLNAILTELNKQSANYDVADDYFKYCLIQLEQNGFVPVRE